MRLDCFDPREVAAFTSLVLGESAEQVCGFSVPVRTGSDRSRSRLRSDHR